MSTNERDLDASVTRALQELLAGRVPDTRDTAILTGAAKVCIESLIEALHADGVQAVRKAFTALVKDQPWLGRLASQSPESAEQEQKLTRRIRFLPDSEFENRPPRQWLIPSILPKEGVAMVFGPPGCGKSFLAMDWALCIASGREWVGHPVLQGPVAYIAGEGAFGIGPRMRAWKTQHGFTGNSGVQWFGEEVVLQDTSNANEVIAALSEDFAEPPVLVVIDTLSRCSGGADENSNTEMAKVIATADILQRQFHCTVLLVHHSGKDRDRGPRGASSLVGNTETIIAVDAIDGGCRVTCYKQKDAPKFDAISLKLEQVQYGPEEGENSAVLVVGDEKMEKAPLKMTPSEQLMYTALIDKELTYGDWKQAGMEYAKLIGRRLGEKAAEGSITSLKKSGRVQLIGKLYAIVSDQQEGQQESSEEE